MTGAKNAVPSNVKGAAFHIKRLARIYWSVELQRRLTTRVTTPSPTIST